MAEKKTLLELDLGTEAVVAKSVELKTNLESLRVQLDALKKSEGDNTAEIVKLEAAIKKVSTEYTNNQKVVQALIETNAKSIPVQDKVNLLLQKEITSREQSKKSITELSKLRDQLNSKNANEAAMIEKLNSKINEHNEFLKESGSQREKQIMNIGNYTESIKNAINETGLFNGQMQGVTQVFQTFSPILTTFNTEINQAFNQMNIFSASARDNADAAQESANAVGMLGSKQKLSAGETENMTIAQKGLTAATNVATGATRIFTLALAATGIGLIIAAVVLLIGYLKTFDPIVDKVEQAFAGVGAAIRVVQQIIWDIISSFSDLGKMAEKLGAFFEDPIGAIEKVGEKMVEAADAAMKLKEAQQDLEDRQRVQSILNKQQEAEISRLILQSKDRTKSEEERIALLQKAEKINRENYESNKKIADDDLKNAIENARQKGQLSQQEVAELKAKGVEYAIYLMNLGKLQNEDVEKLEKATEKKIEIYNRSTAEQEKIINRQNALIEKAEKEAEERRKKAEEARKKALDNAAKLAKAELDLFISQQGYRAKTLEEQLAIEQKALAKRMEIYKKEYEASEKTKADKLKRLTDENNAQEAFLKKQAELVVDNAYRELQSFIETNNTKIDQSKFFSDLLLAQKQMEYESQLTAELNFQKIRLEQGIISETEYLEAMKSIRDEYKQKNDEAVQLQNEAEAERRNIDLENQRAWEDIVFQDNLAIKLERLEQDRLQEIAAAEKTGASVDAINKKYNAAKLRLEREARMIQIDNARMTLGEISQLSVAFFGENKALSYALASADMFLAIQKAYTSQLQATPDAPIRAALAAAKAGAFGLANLVKIAGVKLADGGMVFGPGTEKSDSIPAMLSNGESVINARSTKMFAPILSWINQLGGGRKFATGGIATSSIGSSIATSVISSALAPEMNYDALASKIAEANRSLPIPVLPVEAFYAANQTYVDVTTMASHG